jgi:hypothetical protein
MLTAKTVIDQLHCFRYENDVDFTTTLGPELEFFVYDQNCNPVNLTQYPDIIYHIKHAMVTGTDLGLNQFEISSKSHHSLMGYLKAMKKVFTFLMEQTPSSTWLFEFNGTAHKTCGRVKGGAYDAKISALEKEDSVRGMLTEKCMTRHASFQINIGVSRFGGVFSHESKKLMYAFTNWGPALAVYFETLTHNKILDRLPNAYKFTTDIRGPMYKTWEFCDNLEEELLKVPQLITKDDDGTWRVYGKCPSSLNAAANIAHTGGIFWIVRPQAIGDKGAERMEFRALSAMSPLHGAYTLRFVNQLVTYVQSTRVQDLPVLTESEWHTCMGNTRTPVSHQEKITIAQKSLLQKLPVSLLWSV